MEEISSFETLLISIEYLVHLEILYVHYKSPDQPFLNDSNAKITKLAQTRHAHIKSLNPSFRHLRVKNFRVVASAWPSRWICVAPDDGFPVP